jgi:hypothetical protein
MVWVKRKKPKKAQDKMGNVVAPSVVFFALMICLGIILGMIGYHKSSGTTDPKTLEEVLGNYPSLILFALIATSLFYNFELRPSSKRQNTVVMCDKCERVKNADVQSKCECGGAFCPLENFEWKEK